MWVFEVQQGMIVKLPRHRRDHGQQYYALEYPFTSARLYARLNTRVTVRVGLLLSGVRR